MDFAAATFRRQLTTLLLCSSLQWGCSHINHESSRSVVLRPPIVATAFVGDSAGWVVTNKGNLLHTNDGGMSWRNNLGETAADFEKISFIDDLQGWAFSRDGEIWRTTDAGDRWRLTARLNYFDDSFGGGVEEMVFLNETDGWLVCPFAVWQTVDGGVSWKQQTPYRTIQQAVAKCRFIDRRKAWLVDQGGGIYRSEDSGETWSKQGNAPNGVDWGSVEFHDDKTVWLKAEDGIYSTRDAGATWQKQLTDHLDLRFDSMQFINEDEIWLSGRQRASSKLQTSSENLEIHEEEYESICLHSLDGGRSWDTIELPQKWGYSVETHFGKAQKGWLVVQKRGQERDTATVYRSTDNGKSWTKSLSLE